MTALRTAIVGFGMIAAGNADDPVMGKAYQYSCHAEVLAAHPLIQWDAVVDPSAGARQDASLRWKVPNVVADVEELKSLGNFDLIVLATPPEGRAEIIRCFEGVKGFLIEKPLGRTLQDSKDLMDVCSALNKPVQVNLWRRGDRAFRDLAAGELEKKIGKPQAVFGVYGNGLGNNGIHMIDFVRMLVGDVVSVQALSGAGQQAAGPIAGDVQFPFSLTLEGGIPAHFVPVDFDHYRENAIDIWGSKGRLSILQDCRTILAFDKRPHRGLSDNFEIASEEPDILSATFGDALYQMYDNLIAAINKGVTLVSPIEQAMKDEQIVHALLSSVANGGRAFLAEGSSM